MLFNGAYGPVNTREDYVYFTNNRDYSEIVFDAESVYNFPPAVPRKPAYISEAKVGNVDSYVHISMENVGR